MAIDEVRDFDSWESQDFVLAQKRYYPIRIEIGHWQLRNYISAPEPDTIYYAAREHIFSFDTRTQIRTYLCPLKFTARCTAAAHGYMVVGGGAEGSFAVVYTGDHPHAEVDATLPINLARHQSSRSIEPSVPLVTYHILGEEIVNSVSIHKLKGQEPGVRDDVVAVITNNDKSVRIFSLTQSKETFVAHLRFAANHASISPCGSLLLAVGDYQEAYFFERSDFKASTVKGRLFSYASSLCNWYILNVVPLHVSKPAQLAAYFTTAWSPDGRLCAMGSECGFITIFDVDVLMEAEDGEDAILAVIPSTRPDAQPQPGAGAPGAVRSMVFSPPPWDLLIWGEDQGRVCVADLRAGLRARQVLTLDPNESNLQRTPITMNVAGMSQEQPAMNAHMPEGGSSSRAHSTANNITAASVRYRQAVRRIDDQLIRDGSSYSNLSLHERQVLDSLRLSDRTPPYRVPDNPLPRNLDYTASDVDEDSQDFTPTSAALSDFAAELPALTRSIAAYGRNPELAAANLETIQDYLRRRYPLPPRSSSNRDAEILEPTSRTTTRQATEDESGARPEQHSLTEDGEDPHDHFSSAIHEEHVRILRRFVQLEESSTVSNLRPIQSTRHAPMSPSTTDLPSLMGSSASSAATFSQLMNHPAANTRRWATSTSEQESTASQPLSSLETAASRRHRSIQSNRERNSHHRDSPLGRYQQSLINSRRMMTGHPDPHCGPQIAGLAMSRSGETLWCAAECGIWEFKINVRGRMGCKAEEMR